VLIVYTKQAANCGHCSVAFDARSLAAELTGRHGLCLFAEFDFATTIARRLGVRIATVTKHALTSTVVSA
jgi:hypothetical protein